MHRRPAILAAALWLGALAAAGCGDSDDEQGFESGDEDAPVPVETVALETGSIEDTLRFSATLRAERAIQVLSRTAGQVRERKVEEGDEVDARDVLLRIEADEQNTALSRIDSDLALARRNLERQKKLHAQGVVSEQSLENARAEVERLDIARRDATRSLGHTVVRAPIDGTITQRFVEFGDIITPNQPLVEIVDLDSLLAEVFVPEKDIHRVSTESPARLASPSSGEALPDAEVERIAPIVDPRSGTVKVTLALPDTTGLRPGMFVDVHLVVASEDDALLLPRRALVYDNDQPYAFKLVGDDRVARVPVEIDIEDREVIKPSGGFEAGDRVVVAGQVGLKDDARVDPKPAPDDDTARAEREAPEDTDEPTP